MNRTRLKVQLVKHEGKRNRVYKDTVGKLTIGVGRNLEDRGLSDDEIAVLLDNDITEIWQDLTRSVPCFGALDEVRQHVLIDMGFMGVQKLLGFTRMLAALETRDFEKAADEMLDSKWARQVGSGPGQRAHTLARMMRSGVA